ncbi:MAG: hypothetical protein AB7M05_10310 [Alphaproteobacteria bacterium]
MKKINICKTIVASTVLSLALAACGGSDNNKNAYEACIASGKRAGSPTEKAEFAPMDKAEFAGMQDSSIAVIVPYKLDGQDGKLQCSIVKNQDGTFKNQLE